MALDAPEHHRAPHRGRPVNDDLARTLADAAKGGERFARSKQTKATARSTDRAVKPWRDQTRDATINGRSAGLIRGDALRMPLRARSVDLIVTSPPYFDLRNYEDGGEAYAGQIGAEPTATDFLVSLWTVLDECWRVLKTTGSAWVNLGDKYSMTNASGIRTKSLMMIPEAFRLGAIDPKFRCRTATPWFLPSEVHHPKWIARGVVIWDKPNAMPEPVSDRVRRSHEEWVHLVKAPRYFTGVDEIREAPTTIHQRDARKGGDTAREAEQGSQRRRRPRLRPWSPRTRSRVRVGCRHRTLRRRATAAIYWTLILR